MTQSPRRAYRFLAVDDDPAIARLLTRVAGTLGFDASAVTEPDQVVETEERLRPDLILLDLSMPGLDGVEILRALAEARCRAQVCLISGAGKGVVDAAWALGKELGLQMATSLYKPLGLDQVQRALRGFQRGSGRAEPTVEDLDEALQEGAFVPHYQPKVDLVSGRVTGVEVLARWTSEELGAISPACFIPVAEEAGAIGRLTRQIVQRAFEELAGLGELSNDLGIAINLSPRLLHDLEYPDQLLDLTLAAGIDPDLVMIEITESEAMRNPSRYLDILVRFRLKGFHLSVDDFGTGFSSLVHLYTLPFEEIKIDKTFVADLCESEQARVIVKAMVALGKGLGLAVVAEGIEDQETAEALVGYGCKLGQGFHFCVPQGIDGLRAHLSGAELSTGESS